MEELLPFIPIFICFGLIVAEIVGLIIFLSIKRKRDSTIQEKTKPRVYRSITLKQSIKTRNEVIGERGEESVEYYLRQWNADKEFYLVNNLLFSDNKGYSTQIDHIFINQNGLWVIETKNRAGEIYGNDQIEKWVQILGNGDIRHEFYNPVKQNETHIRQLKRRINISAPIYSIVLFPRADISHVDSNFVYDLEEFQRVAWIPTDVHLSEKAMKFYFEQIEILGNVCKITEEQHIKRIRKKYKEDKEYVVVYSDEDEY